MFLANIRNIKHAANYRDTKSVESLLKLYTLARYRWAYESKNSFLKTTIFASTMTDKEEAMIFHFPSPSNFAINLAKIPELNLPCLSNFEYENEILLYYPKLFSRFINIEYNTCNEK